jgi:hypothetical protein
VIDQWLLNEKFYASKSITRHLFASDIDLHQLNERYRSKYCRIGVELQTKEAESPRPDFSLRKSRYSCFVAARADGNRAADSEGRQFAVRI